ncbi:MAG TPA: hypothetical protein VIY27_00120 [Myxococcota bacterium]
MATKRAFWISLLVGCPILACAMTPEGDDSSAQLEALLAREAEPLAEIALASPAGAFTARVAARGPAAFRPIEGDVEHAVLDIGAPSPMSCNFFDEEQDLAGSLLGLSELLLEALAAELGPLALRNVHAVDAGSIRGHSFLALDWLYQGGGSVGLLKQRMASVSGRSVYCYHDQVGYDATFARVFEGLVASLRYAGPSEPAPYYTEVSVTTIGGHRVGVSRVEMIRDAEGDTQILQISAMLMPRSAEQVLCIDSADIEWSRPDGSLINRVHNQAEGRELVSSLELVPSGDTWRVSGVYRLEDIDAQFTVESPLFSYLGEYLSLRRAVAAQGRDARVAFLKWLPNVDPRKPLQVTYEVTGIRAGGGYAARSVTGPLEMSLLLDSSGTPHRGSLDLGIATLEVERVYASGRF